jgi:hypothetical protein
LIGWLAYILPALRVHSWGGFGSQLFAAHAILRIQKLFPYRRIKVIIHSSGVTKRTKEVDFSLIGINAFQKEDFEQLKLDSIEKKGEKRLILVIKMLALNILKALRFVFFIIDEKLFLRIKPWTISLRCHYTDIQLDRLCVVELYNLLGLGKNDIRMVNTIAVHYRLGDLLHLPNKSPISTERVEDVIKELDLKSPILRLTTDSTVFESKAFLSTSAILGAVNPENNSPLNTVRLCVTSEVFIGTTAKISIWVAAFRQLIHDQRSYMPEEMQWISRIGLVCKWY